MKSTPQIVPLRSIALAQYALPLVFNHEQFARAMATADRVLGIGDNDDRYEAGAAFIEDEVKAKMPDTHAALQQAEEEPLWAGTVHNAFADPALQLGFCLAYRLLTGAR
jgi:hypothetical protein